MVIDTDCIDRCKDNYHVISSQWPLYDVARLSLQSTGIYMSCRKSSFIKDRHTSYTETSFTKDRCMSFKKTCYKKYRYMS